MEGMKAWVGQCFHCAISHSVSVYPKYKMKKDFKFIRTISSSVNYYILMSLVDLILSQKTPNQISFEKMILVLE